MLRWTCHEADCTAVVRADDDDTLIERVNEHMAEFHDSFDLDPGILAATEDVEE